MAGCVRRDGRNSDCQWPGEKPVRAPTARHLSEDAEFAEDLAIRHADTHHGLRTPKSGEAYASARDRCLGSLYETTAREHGVPVNAVSGALGRNRGYVDLVEYLSFFLLYCCVSIALARWIWRKYAPVEHGWIPAITMTLFLSLVLATASTMIGET
jgi:hypothetical protein